MTERFSELLRYAITEIESLEDYYDAHKRNVEEYEEKNIKKYLLGVLLDRFFSKEIYNTEEIVISEEESNLLSRIIVNYNIEQKDDGISVSYVLNEELIPEWMEPNPEKSRREFIKIVQQPDILRKSMLMMLLVKFEESIAGIYKFLLLNYPQAYLSDKSITYTELLAYNSDINEIRNRLVEREVEDFMRMPISDWYDIFSKKHNASFSFNCGEFDTFREIYYCRNLIVHNKGIVNEVYLRNVRETEKHIGEEVEVCDAYLKKAFVITKIILIGSFWGLRKVAEDREELTRFLFNYGYNSLVDGEWNTAKYINSILLEDEDQEYADFCCEKVNKWIAIKNAEGINSIREEIEALDVSAMKMQFSIAKHALLDDYEKVTNCLDEAIGNQIPVWCIKEWPLLLQYRETKEYAHFVERHMDLFKEEGYEPSDEIVNNENDIALEIEESLSETVCETDSSDSSL